MRPIVRKIRYESDRDPSFAQEISKIPGCEELQHCIQCGTCSATCPLSIYMDYPPRRVVYLTRAGFKQVLGSWSIWLCASCYGCTVECPKQIKVTDLMYALKRRAIQEKIYPKKFPIPILSKAFFNMVRKRGRTSEGRLVIGLFLKTSIAKLFGMTGLGLNLLRTGRLSLKSESIKGRKQLAKMLNEV